MKVVGVIKEVLLVKGERKREELSVLLDSGASRSLIKSDIANGLAIPRDLPMPIKVRIADGHEVIASSTAI